MQTKLRMLCLLFVASLLWTFRTSAATQQAKVHEAAQKLKLQYVGIASWYGEQHQGKKMANGQRFDRKKLTAASWYLPFGKQILVINLNNGESVVVTITDRGPNHRLNRIIELSEAAAQRLDYIGQGLTKVFLYPLPAFETARVPLDATLVEPQPSATSAEYEAKALNTPM
jgi:rare lipoprotein A